MSGLDDSCRSYSSSLQLTSDRPDAAAAPLLGDLLIIGAQVLQASQFIIEEKYLAQVSNSSSKSSQHSLQKPDTVIPCTALVLLPQVEGIERSV